MSYHALGATPSELVDRAIEALPSCYSQALDDCVKDRPSSLPQCDAINEAYAIDFDRMEAAVVGLPYCPGTSGVLARGAVLLAAGAAVAAAALFVWPRVR